jgi:hypothetical protein
MSSPERNYKLFSFYRTKRTHLPHCLGFLSSSPAPVRTLGRRNKAEDKNWESNPLSPARYQMVTTDQVLYLSESHFSHL